MKRWQWVVLAVLYIAGGAGEGVSFLWSIVSPQRISWFTTAVLACICAWAIWLGVRVIRSKGALGLGDVWFWVLQVPTFKAPSFSFEIPFTFTVPLQFSWTYTTGDRFALGVNALALVLAVLLDRQMRRQRARDRLLPLGDSRPGAPPPAEHIAVLSRQRAAKASIKPWEAWLLGATEIGGSAFLIYLCQSNVEGVAGLSRLFFLGFFCLAVWGVWLGISTITARGAVGHADLVFWALQILHLQSPFLTVGFYSGFALLLAHNWSAGETSIGPAAGAVATFDLNTTATPTVLGVNIFALAIAIGLWRVMRRPRPSAVARPVSSIASSPSEIQSVRTDLQPGDAASPSALIDNVDPSPSLVNSGE